MTTSRTETSVIEPIVVVPTRSGLLIAARQLAVLDLANENRRQAQECRQFWWRIWRPVRAVNDPEGHIEAMTRFHFNNLGTHILYSISKEQGSAIDYGCIPELPVKIVVHGKIDRFMLMEIKFS
jgi:hypothetical protein